MTDSKLYSSLLSILLLLAAGAEPVMAADLPPKAAATVILAQRPEMKDFEKAVLDFMYRWDIPGVSLTVSYKGKVVYSKGLGITDRMTGIAVNDKSIFRVASLSKSITAVGVLLLYQQGKLDLDQKVFELLKDITPCDPKVRVDPRINTMTIRNLLECSSGWDQNMHGDPIFGHILMDAGLNCSRSLRPTATSMIRRLLNDQLDFKPGTNYAYSNVSYVVLGKVIEKVSGMSYEDFIRKNVLLPMNLPGIVMGSTLKKQAKPFEVTYYPDADEDGPSLLPNVRGPLSNAYGGYFLLEAAPASIGWISTTEDMVRFADIIGGELPGSPLNQNTTALMFERPSLAYWRGEPEYFAKGWEVQRDAKENMLNFSRHGSLPGLMALVEHQTNGLSWAAALNSRPKAYVECREEFKAMFKKVLAKIQPGLK